jgi:rRNA maturation endonuclease Nob1
MFGVTYKDLDHDGYMPDLDCIGCGDYINVDICAECGQVQGNFPMSDEKIRKAIEEA